jgi:hypothetical protein
MNHVTSALSASHTDPNLPAADQGAVLASMLKSDLGRRLTLLLLEAPGESHSACDKFYQGLVAYQELRVLHELLVPDADIAQVEQALSTAVGNDADAVLVWAEPKTLLAVVPEEVYPRAWHWPRTVLEAAEDINLFDHCFIALVGEDVDRQNARRIGYEDGFTSTISVDTLAGRLLGEALARAESQRHGSSPPCYL